MATAHKQQYYKSGVWEYVDSERYYERHEITTTSVEEFFFTPTNREMAIRTIFVDEETGIVVKNIERFEEWIKKVEGR